MSHKPEGAPPSRDKTMTRAEKLKLRAARAYHHWVCCESDECDDFDAEAADTMLAAIVDELGITWEMVDALNARVAWAEPFEGAPLQRDNSETADALATLLEAAGVER